MELHFERMAQIIAIAAVGSDDKGVSRFFLKSGEITIRFSEYVKSQVHLNVVHGLYGRDLREYVETLFFLEGKTSYEESALKVLRYFYLDLSGFLINNANDVNLIVEVDTNYFNLPKVKYNLVDLGEELRQGYLQVESGELAIKDWKYAKVLDYVDDVQDLKSKFVSYAFASVLREYGCADKMSIVESG